MALTGALLLVAKSSLTSQFHISTRVRMLSTPCKNRITDKKHGRKCIVHATASVIREIIAMGTPVVTGSGNGVELPDGYPALFGDPTSP